MAKNAMKKPASTKKQAATKDKPGRLDDITDDEPSEYMDTSKKRKFDAMWNYIPKNQQLWWHQAPLHL